jgi:hypothetical protein
VNRAKFNRYGVFTVVGYIKGKSAIAIARTYLGKRNNFTGQNFWARGYFVSTIGGYQGIYSGTGSGGQTAGPVGNVQRQLTTKTAFRRFQNQPL